MHGPLAKKFVDVLQLVEKLLVAQVGLLEPAGLIGFGLHLQGHAELFVLVSGAGGDFFGVCSQAHVFAGHGRVLLNGAFQILNLAADIADLLRHHLSALAHLREVIFQDADGIDVDDHTGDPAHQ